MLQIGRYEVIRELGRGAMGVVFEARDPLIGRTVAVKTIRLDALGNPSEAEWLQERLFREARSAGALSHAGIVVVYDMGRHEKLAFIAMERVDGPTLEQVLATGGLPSRGESMNILRQTAAALDYAHQNGVVHRDIKPANLMLHKGVMLKITDFGIAKVTSAPKLTKTGMAMGTPSYMSPEQIGAQAVDGCADQFSLAVIAFELLVGRKPFQADTLAGLVYQIVHEERPSARASRPDLPEAADAVLKRGLARDAKDRYPSCMAYVNALEDGLAKIAAPVLAEPTRLTIVENRCAVCGTVLTEGQPCSFCASFAGSETIFKKAFGIADEEQPVEVIAERPEPVPLAALELPTLPLPGPPRAELPATLPPSHPKPSLTTERSAPRVRALLPRGWRPWAAAAAAIVAIAAAVGWMIIHRQPAPAQIVAEPSAPPTPGAPRVNPSDGLKYVWIPPGSFAMGCSPGDNECYDDEKPPHQVSITKGFWIGQTEVTQEAYQKVTGKNPSSFKGAKLPVESISWNDAQGFCQAAGMRLPTEAEWEYAARAGSTQSRYGDLAAVAWYSENSGGKTHEVAQKAANAWELYDTLGNVWEWTADWYEEGKTRALRGGSWDDGSRGARVSYRVRVGPVYRITYIGVRCVGESL